MNVRIASSDQEPIVIHFESFVSMALIKRFENLQGLVKDLMNLFQIKYFMKSMHFN